MNKEEDSVNHNDGTRQEHSLPQSGPAKKQHIYQSIIELKVSILQTNGLQIRFSREKFEPGLGYESRISRSLAWCQARDLEIRGSNPGSGSNFLLLKSNL